MHIENSTFFLVSAVTCAVATISLGVWAAALRAGFTSNKAVALGTGTASVAIAWLALTAFLANSGWLTDWSSRPPRIPLLPITLVISLIWLGRTQTFKTMLAAIPVWWLVAFESFRMLVEFGLWFLYLEGIAPIQVTFQGTNHDGLAAVAAPIIALGAWRGWFGKWALTTWNVFGIAMLGTAIWSSATSVPGPFQLAWHGEPFVALGSWPVVWIPAFLAPCALFIHVTSLRQTLGMQRRSSAMLFSENVGSIAGVDAGSQGLGTGNN